MSTGLIVLIFCGVALAVALAIEDSREFIVESLESGWESVSELFSGAFEDVWDLSFYGLAFGILAVGAIYCTRYLNIDGSGMGSIESMVKYMKTGQRVLWTTLSYLGVFLGGYFIGKGFENT